ncbi:hypothetical protein [Pseudooctadecabacter jejudonensis]|uniref:Peptidase M48 domain-containing protein n=1 Tax=Pseudooctadecabacter jejudonensis TaxID=1391910 RepID=A0A1Y5SPW4_9RHOB|nr:hypothetical protein [Pseudooctadecabacter jejudonensis]SLN42600.1 hypothetical protein PSJ8397_02162 [Pseudooctadecabacter jejudonensis]
MTGKQTALTEFSRLESGGLWRATPDAQLREVLVSFGEATLVISDTAARPLTHWSLPAVSRLNLGERPAVFSPDGGQTETLEISDDLMIDAMEKVRKTVRRRRARPGRLRSAGLGAAALAILGLGVFWLPDALVRQAMTVVPQVKRAEFGATLLGHIQRVAGQTCRSTLGSDALAKVHRRALGAQVGGQVFVVPTGAEVSLYLPGGLIVMNRDLIEDTEDPAVVAGHIIAAAGQLHADDPLAALLRDRGIGTTFTLLTTGEIAPETLQSYAEDLFATPPARASDSVLLPLFEAASLPSTPYAYAVDITGESTLGLIEADPMQGRDAAPILTDAEWISLQGICS